MKKHLFLLIAVCISMLFALEFSSIKNIYRGPTERPATWKTPSHNFEIIDEWEVDLKPGQYVLFSPASETDSGEPKIIMEEGKNRAYHIHDGEMELVPFSVINLYVSTNSGYVLSVDTHFIPGKRSDGTEEFTLHIAKLNNHDMELYTHENLSWQDYDGIPMVTNCDLMVIDDTKSHDYALIDFEMNVKYHSTFFSKYPNVGFTTRSSLNGDRIFIKAVSCLAEEPLYWEEVTDDRFHLFIHDRNGNLINSLEMPGDFEMKPSTTGAYCWLSIQDTNESWLIDGQGNVVQKFEYLTCVGWSPQDDFCHLISQDKSIGYVSLYTKDLTFYKKGNVGYVSGLYPPYQVISGANDKDGTGSISVQNYITRQVIISDNLPAKDHFFNRKGNIDNRESMVSKSGNGQIVCVFHNGLVRKYRIGSEK